MQRTMTDRHHNWTDGELYKKWTRNPSNYYGGQWAIYHEARDMYVQSHQWVEVTHLSNGFGIAEERNLMWLAYAPGSLVLTIIPYK